MAFSLAECLDAIVLVFAVARPSDPATSVELEAVLEREGTLCGRFQEDHGAGPQSPTLTSMAVRHPAEQIIHRAEADGIDLIILGRPSAGGFSESL